MPHCHTALQLIRISNQIQLCGSCDQEQSSRSLLLDLVQLQCAFVISSDTAAGGRKCQYGFESAKAACEDKPESRPRNTRAAAVFALQRSRFS